MAQTEQHDKEVKEHETTFTVRCTRHGGLLAGEFYEGAMLRAKEHTNIEKCSGQVYLDVEL